MRTRFNRSQSSSIESRSQLLSLQQQQQQQQKLNNNNNCNGKYRKQNNSKMSGMRYLTETHLQGFERYKVSTKCLEEGMARGGGGAGQRVTKGKNNNHAQGGPTCSWHHKNQCPCIFKATPINQSINQITNSFTIISDRVVRLYVVFTTQVPVPNMRAPNFCLFFVLFHTRMNRNWEDVIVVCATFSYQIPTGKLGR